MAKNEAIWEAGHKRAQPIVMTTIAMVAGMLPTALSLSGDGSWRQPMGITVIGGLIFSTLLTLVLVPSYFSIAISIETRLGSADFPNLIGSEAHATGPAIPRGVNCAAMFELMSRQDSPRANVALSRFNPASSRARGA